MDLQTFVEIDVTTSFLAALREHEFLEHFSSRSAFSEHLVDATNFKMKFVPWCESTLIEDGCGGVRRAVSEVSPQIYDFLRFLAI